MDYRFFLFSYPRDLTDVKADRIMIRFGKGEMTITALTQGLDPALCHD